MSVTTNFLKLRSTDSTIKLNEWHNNFTACKNFAEANNVPLVAVWSNGDNCSHCTNLESYFLSDMYKDWMSTSQCVFWFGYCDDTNQEDKYLGTGFNWCYQKGKISQYPFVRIYWQPGGIDVTKPGAVLYGRGAKPSARPKVLVTNLTKILANYKSYLAEATKMCNNVEQVDYKIRLNESLTVAKVNKILDAIDKNDGYCPCQPPSETSKCHCEDFIKNKKIGEPCICNIYVKQKKEN